MDFEHYGRADLAWFFVDSYVRASGDSELLTLLYFYVCYRAYVRGKVRSLRLAQLLHLLTFVALIAFGFVANLTTLYFWSMPLIAVALVYEHRTEKRDLSGINRAFFQSNAFVSAVFLIAVCADRLL